MADKKEIETNNRLIAEFMGAKYIGKDRMNGHDYDMFDFPESFPITLSTADDFGMKRTGYLGFHERWDWLMIVFEKINENPSEYDISIEARGCWLTFIHEGRVEKAMIDKFPLIECVWLMVVAFIKWYNAQSKSNQ